MHRLAHQTTTCAVHKQPYTKCALHCDVDNNNIQSYIYTVINSLPCVSLIVPAVRLNASAFLIGISLAKLFLS
jgi:hypothetical protein